MLEMPVICKAMMIMAISNTDKGDLTILRSIDEVYDDTWKIPALSLDWMLYNYDSYNNAVFAFQLIDQFDPRPENDPIDVLADSIRRFAKERFHQGLKDSGVSIEALYVTMKGDTAIVHLATYATYVGWERRITFWDVYFNNRTGYVITKHRAKTIEYDNVTGSVRIK